MVQTVIFSISQARPESEAVTACFLIANPNPKLNPPRIPQK